MRVQYKEQKMDLHELAEELKERFKVGNCEERDKLFKEVSALVQEVRLELAARLREGWPSS